MIVDPTRICELLVGLGDVTVLGADDEHGGPVRVHVQTRSERPVCPGCGGPVWSKDQRPVELVDMAAFGRPARLVWHKHRWSCPAPACVVGSFTETAGHIAAPRLVMTDRAGRWVTEQVGRFRRSVNELAVELGCDGTRSTTPSSPMGHRWSRTLSGSARSKPWACMRRCSPGSDRGAPSTGPPRSSTSAEASSST